MCRRASCVFDSKNHLPLSKQKRERISKKKTPTTNNNTEQIRQRCIPYYNWMLHLKWWKKTCIVSFSIQMRTFTFICVRVFGNETGVIENVYFNRERSNIYRNISRGCWIYISVDLKAIYKMRSGWLRCFSLTKLTHKHIVAVSLSLSLFLFLVSYIMNKADEWRMKEQK